MPDSQFIVRVPVRTFKVQWRCVCGHGELIATGRTWPRTEARESVEHECTDCGRKDWARDKYPIIEYEDEE